MRELTKRAGNMRWLMSLLRDPRGRTPMQYASSKDRVKNRRKNRGRGK